MKPFASNFISTFLGVVVASLVVAFFSLMWARSARVEVYERKLELLRAIDDKLTKEIAELKVELKNQAESQFTLGPPQSLYPEPSVEEVNQAQEQIQGKIDKEIYRIKELRK